MTIGRMKGLSSRVTPTGTASLQIRPYTIPPFTRRQFIAADAIRRLKGQVDPAFT
jgi:hypothetical protein